MTVKQPKSTLAVLIVVLLVVGTMLTALGDRSTTAAADAREGPKAVLVRKNVKDLTAAEKAELVAAIKKLKKMPSPYLRDRSYYDSFVEWHLLVSRCQYACAHMRPGFLPWHRAFLLAFEQALSKAAGKPMVLPYWDWTDPESTKAVFADDFMGPFGKKDDDYAVTSGPFRKGEWAVTVHGPPSDDPAQFSYLVRAAGTAPIAPHLPTAKDIEKCLQLGTYDVPPYDLGSDPAKSFRQAFEGWVGFGTEAHGECVDGIHQATLAKGADPSQMKLMNHNRVHFYVGGMFKPSDKVHLHGERFSAKAQGLKGYVYGTMIPATSPNDPVFFVHHCYVDRIWAAWQTKHPDAWQPKENGPAGQNLDDTLPPFKGVLDTYTIKSVQDISKLGYTYDKLPRVP